MKLKKTIAVLLISATALSGCSLFRGSQASASATAPTTSSASKASIASKAEEEKIKAGIKVAALELSGLTKEEALKKAKDYQDRLLNKEIGLIAGGITSSIKYSDIKFQADIIGAVKKAIDENKSQEPKVTFDEDKLKELVKAFAESVDKNETNAKAAKIVDSEALLSEVRKNITADASPAKVIGIMKEDVAKLTKPEGEPNSEVRVVGYATTNYSSSGYNRASNVQLASSYINEVTVNPGEVFSFNDHVGDTSYAKGYLDGVAYKAGEMVVEPGGGVCQVSTTLYMAVLDAGLEVDERYNHGSIVHYTDYGMDATVYYPSVDFKFRNNFTYPITIYSWSDGRDLKVSIKGKPPTITPYSYKFDYVVTGTQEAGYITKQDNSVAAGSSVIDYYPLDGVTADIYRLVYKDGELIDREYMYTDTYRPMEGLKLVGPSGTPAPAETKPSTTAAPATTAPAATKPATTTPPATKPATTTAPSTTAPATTAPATSTTTPETTTPATGSTTPETGSTTTETTAP